MVTHTSLHHMFFLIPLKCPCEIGFLSLPFNGLSLSLSLSLQFLCLKNIRTFLKVCHDKFGLRNSELFDPFDLFDVRDFGKVREKPQVVWTSAVLFST